MGASFESIIAVNTSEDTSEYSTGGIFEMAFSLAVCHFKMR